MYKITAYYVKDYKKEFISERSTNDFYAIGDVMRQMATNIVDRIKNSEFDDIPEDFDCTISDMLGDNYNRYRFVGIPSNRYFCIMCHMMDSKTSHDVIMFRGCEISVSKVAVITIGDHKVIMDHDFTGIQTFYDIFDHIEDTFERDKSNMVIDNIIYRAVLMKFDSTNHITFEQAFYAPYSTDMVDCTKKFLTAIRDKYLPRSEVRVQRKLDIDFEPSVYGFITTDNRKHEYKLQCVPIYTISDGRTIIYNGFPIIKDTNKYIVKYNYDTEIGRFDTIDEAYDFIDRKVADYMNKS